jgi:hypothetical protein
VNKDVANEILGTLKDVYNTIKVYHVHSGYNYDLCLKDLKDVIQKLEDEQQKIEKPSNLKF